MSPHADQKALCAELTGLARYLDQALRAISRIEAPVQATSAQLPLAAAHLSDIASLTEAGTHRVMELVEAIQADHASLLADLSGMLSDYERAGCSPPEGRRLDAVMRLIRQDDERLLEVMTTLSFQDLVGQRVKKLVTILNDVQHRLLEMLVVFGARQDAVDPYANGQAGAMLAQLEASRSTALNQDLVDQILGQFGSP